MAIVGCTVPQSAGPDQGRASIKDFGTGRRRKEGGFRVDAARNCQGGGRSSRYGKSDGTMAAVRSSPRLSRP